MNAELLIAELKRKFSIKTDRALADRLGMTVIALNNWKRKSTPLTARQIANAIDKSSKVAVTLSQRGTLQPIVEFFPIDYASIGKVGKYAVVPTGKDGGQHYNGLKEELEKATGLYIFYDSRGKALYAGQTKKQNLWKEMNLAFNRVRSAQVVTLVPHPIKDVVFRLADDKVRQPKDMNLKLHDMAAYFSAYSVADGMVDDLEALLVRAFPNDLLNFKMEKFGKEQKKAVTAKKNPVKRKSMARSVKK